MLTSLIFPLTLTAVDREMKVPSLVQSSIDITTSDCYSSQVQKRSGNHPITLLSMEEPFLNNKKSADTPYLRSQNGMTDFESPEFEKITYTTQTPQSIGQKFLSCVGCTCITSVLLLWFCGLLYSIVFDFAYDKAPTVCTEETGFNGLRLGGHRECGKYVFGRYYRTWDENFD